MINSLLYEGSGEKARQQIRGTGRRKRRFDRSGTAESHTTTGPDRNVLPATGLTKTIQIATTAMLSLRGCGSASLCPGCGLRSNAPDIHKCSLLLRSCALAGRYGGMNTSLKRCSVNSPGTTSGSTTGNRFITIGAPDATTTLLHCGSDCQTG